MSITVSMMSTFKDLPELAARLPVNKLKVSVGPLTVERMFPFGIGQDLRHIFNDAVRELETECKRKNYIRIHFFYSAHFFQGDELLIKANWHVRNIGIAKLIGG